MAGLFSRLFGKKKERGPFCAAVVAAAGSSTRMGGQDKLMLPLGEEPVLAHTLRALELCPYITEIVVVTRRDLIVPIGQMCQDRRLEKVSRIIPGGSTRTQSVLNGVLELGRRAELVAIHDGARPLVSQALLEAVITRAAQCGAAAPAVPVKDTVKRAKNAVVTETLDRAELFAVQTPQVFQTDLIRGALERALEEGAVLTDDCSAVERLGIGVALTQGDYRNLKITTPEDLAAAGAFLEQEEV